MGKMMFESELAELQRTDLEAWARLYLRAHGLRQTARLVAHAAAQRLIPGAIIVKQGAKVPGPDRTWEEFEGWTWELRRGHLVLPGQRGHAISPWYTTAADATEALARRLIRRRPHDWLTPLLRMLVERHGRLPPNPQNSTVPQGSAPMFAPCELLRRAQAA